MASKPIPVRLSAMLLARLDKVGSQLGVPRTQVIKMCLMAFLQRFEREGLGMLPPDWENQVKNLDGRTHRYTVTDQIPVAAETPKVPPVERERLKVLRYEKRNRPNKDQK